MRLTLKVVPKCSKRHMGEFIVTGRDRCKILISRQANKEIGVFAETLLHELFHFWITILEQQGLRVSLRKEHKFINGVTPMLLKRLAKGMK